VPQRRLGGNGAANRGADTIKVTGASYVNGLLHIELVREIPEHKKPRKVAIGAAMAPAGPVESRLAAE